MKTTVDIPETLLSEAQKLAREQKTTLKTLIQEGLREAIANRRRARPFKLRDASFGPGKVDPTLKDRKWEDIVHLVYEGRGG